MNCLDSETRARVINCLIEGCSIRATVRMTGAAKNTVVKLLADIGCACAGYHNRAVRNLKVRRLQADEIWCFVGAKAKNVSKEKKLEGWGDIWTWVGIDADTKLVVSYLVGGRDGGVGGGMTKLGSGALTLSGYLYYSGSTLVSLGTPVSFVARLPALAPRGHSIFCTMIGTSGLTAKRLHGWPFTCTPRPCESPSTVHLLLRPDSGCRRVLRGIPLCRGRKPTFRARVPDWICGGHDDYLQLCAVNLGLSRRYGKSTEYLDG